MIYYESVMKNIVDVTLFSFFFIILLYLVVVGSNMIFYFDL